MEPPFTMRLLHLQLLLVVTTALLITCSTRFSRAEKRPTWIRYTDAMYVICISRKDVTARMKLTTAQYCFSLQRKYIQCVNPGKISRRLLAMTSTSPGQRAPCGIISLSIDKEAPSTMEQWKITAHSQLYLNLTFLELVLPMPYGRCDHSQVAEMIILLHPADTLDSKNATYLCGEHSPFSTVWTNSHVLLVYRRVPSIPQTGHFCIHYQVCDQRVRTFQTQTVQHVSLFQPSVALWLKVSRLPILQSRPNYMIYSVHLFGSRLTQLNVIFVVQAASKQQFSVDAFDGPGPAEVHRHHVEQQELDTRWINFLTFQAYLQITCDTDHCDGVLIKCVWSSGLPQGYNVKITESLTITFDSLPSLCFDGNQLYCLFNISTAVQGYNIEISLQKIHFHGPDNLGGYSEPSSCLLAGVTIADGHRAELMDGEDAYFSGLGKIPRKLAVDSVFPEITTCFDVPLATGDRVVSGFPIDRFVSFSPSLVLVVYAYGAFVNLSRSEIKMVIEISHAAGLTVSCPSIPANGYLTTDATFSGGAVGSRPVKSICPVGTALYVRLISSLEKKPGGLLSEVIICTEKQPDIPNVILVIPHLSVQQGSRSLRSLFVQLNVYASQLQKDCLMEVTDLRSVRQTLNYNLYVQEPVIVGRIAYAVLATTGTYGTQYLPKKAQFDGQYSSLVIYTAYTYIHIELNASMPCSEPFQVKLSEDNKNRLDYHLAKAENTADCEYYVIAMKGNSSNSYYRTHRSSTYLVHLSKPYMLKILSDIMYDQVKVGKVTALKLNWDISQFLFFVRINWLEHYSHACRQMTVRIVYKALVSHSIVSLEWDLLLSTRGFQISLSNIPMSEILMYITLSHTNYTERVCSVVIDARDETKSQHALSVWNATASDQTPFADYQLLWTHLEYTWEEAEEICQQLSGMHLASISSEREYLLLSRMLLGSAYHIMNTEYFYQPFLTPCLMSSPLCLIHIGLKTQNRRLLWTDGRPTGYLRWNKNYIRGRGPDGVKYYSPTNGSVNAAFKRLLRSVQNVLQPQFTNETLCTVLMGSPGPEDMEFVSVPCDSKLLVSGIVCIKGNSRPSKNRPLYRITHLKMKAKDSQLVDSTTHTHYNIDALYEALPKANSFAKHQHVSDASYYEMFNEDTYSRLYNYYSKNKRSAWKEHVYNCSNSTHTFNLCSLFRSYNKSSSNTVQRLTANMFITNRHKNIENSSLSIRIFNKSMFASSYCKNGSVFDGTQCVLLLEKSSGNSLVTLNDRCQAFSSESFPYVYSIEGDLGTLTSILHKVELVGQGVSCHDELGNVLVLRLEEGQPFGRVEKVNDAETEYVMCTLQPDEPKCPPGYVTCNSECISEQFVCDGRADCQNREDEQNCAYLCNASDKTPQHCLTRCHPDNCTCHELYFQCSSGGCIHSSKICDRRADCIDSEDEMFCSDVTSFQYTVGIENDLVSDKEDSSDEEIYMELLRSVGEVAYNACSSVHQFPCLKGHPACYPMDKMCMYDHAEDGRLLYCRNGLHLVKCESFHCSGSFKCQHSYCVPTHKVCDGVHDCPYGDDEVSCPVLACVNMLRCGQTCVHPSEICDGTAHCESGEDEVACGAPQCPPACQCSGYAMKCYNFSVFDGAYGRLIILRIRHPNIVLTNGLFHHTPGLLVLDLSHCRIAFLLHNKPFLELGVLVKLDLSHNKISSLAYGSLDGLSSLTEIDVSFNPLVYLEPRIFVHMSRLRIISLRHCKLSTVPDILLPDGSSLDFLDISSCGRVDLGCLSVKLGVLNMTNSVLHSYKDDNKKCWQHVSHVISDQTGLCCLRLFKRNCAGVLAVGKKCQLLLMNQMVLIYCCILIVVVTASNFCVIMYKLLMQGRDALLICNLGLANILVAVPLYILIKWHILHGGEFAFFEPFLSRSVHLRISGSIFVLSAQLTTIFQLLISLQKYCGIIRGFIIHSKRKLVLYAVIVTVWVGSTLVCLYGSVQDSPSVQTNSMAGGLFHPFRGRKFLLPAFLSVNTICLLGTIFAYMGILKALLETRVIHKMGQKHGRDLTLSSAKRIIAITSLSSVSALGMICLTVWLSLTTAEVPEAVALVVFVFPVNSVLNPIMLTLSTQQFLRDCRVTFPSVVETVGRIMLK